jgi:hypothetical protein
MVEQFWYRSTVAVYKVIREDWLIIWQMKICSPFVVGTLVPSEAINRLLQTYFHRSKKWQIEQDAQRPR